MPRLEINTEHMTLDQLVEAIDYAPTYTEQSAYIDAFFSRWMQAPVRRQCSTCNTIVEDRPGRLEVVCPICAHTL